MKITELVTSNIERVTAVHVKPDPNDPAVFVCGDNDQGKSSTIDSIMLTLLGGRMPTNAVHEGCEKGEVSMTLGGDEPAMFVRKVFKPGQTPSVQVRMPDGLSGGQKVLDRVVGAIGVDPAALASMAPKKQSEAVQKALGIDLNDLDVKQGEVSEQRKLANRRARDMEGEIKAMPSFPGATPVDSQVVIEQIKQAHAKIAAKGDAVSAAGTAVTNVTMHATTMKVQQHDLANLQAKIKEVTAKIADVQQNVLKADQALEEAISAVSAFPSDEELQVPLTTANESLATAEEANRQVDANKRRDDKNESLRGIKNECNALSGTLEKLASERKNRIQSVELPKGLESIDFGPDGLTYEGRPLTQLGTGVSIRVCTQIALAMNPTLRVVLVRRGNDLDKKNLQTVIDTAREQDAQVWIERVERPTSGAVLEIVDGAGEMGIEAECEEEDMANED